MVWHCILRILKPSHVIEVGSGWSSAVLMDTNQYYLNNSVQMKFIEPYPERLKSTLKENDKLSLIETELQKVSLDEFEILNENDILFVDSTHVSKVGSDVNYLFFEILPRLNRGVYIHFHDIFFPFEYPREWIERGQIWNELYLLRAFLQNNQDYEIVYFQNMFEKRHQDLIKKVWPLKFPFYGGSLYIKKI